MKLDTGSSRIHLGSAAFVIIKSKGYKVNCLKSGAAMMANVAIESIIGEVFGS